MNITPAQKSFGLLIFIVSSSLDRSGPCCAGPRAFCAAKCSMHFVLFYLHGMSAFPLRSAFLLRCFILVLPLLAGACGEPPPKFPRLAADAVVLAFGDSLTFGTGAAEQES